ncbi:uncharacterized protein K02A2.6-like [Anneissia japonica]|uniref:uncharacterized protein K02A2.6-like n=1 Tax=Anneissia japonica TaxID=1529436 RepID=UPI0014256679|nr:uncharacterized protein K02A2.6-like [Anneissia japonica]
MGLDFQVETDHKPLISLLMSKELAKLPPGILRLRLMRYSTTVVYVQGKNQVVADALSRAPVDLPTKGDLIQIEEVETFAKAANDSLPATPTRLREIKEAQRSDAEYTQIYEYCKNGWPPYRPDTLFMGKHWEHRHHLSIVDDLILYDNRIVVPRDLQLDMLRKIHRGHLGISKCRGRAAISILWPGMSAMIEDIEYLLVVDYYSRWIAIEQLVDTSSRGIIDILRKLFAVHGIPDTVVSDNGPQYSSKEFRYFSRNWNFVHVTSSPRDPKANGEAERSVRTAKAILKKNDDPYLALLSYRSSPLQNGKSPSELLMNRRLRTQLPTIDAQLTAVPDKSNVAEREHHYREKSSNAV